jgi:signal transduction histidine kinase
MLRSLKAQTVAVILVGLIVANSFGLAIYFRDRQETLVLQDAYDFVARGAGVSRLLRNIPDAWNPEIEAASDSRAFRVWSTNAPVFSNPDPSVDEQSLTADFRSRVTAIRDNEIRIWFRQSNPPDFVQPEGLGEGQDVEASDSALRWTMAISVHHGADEWLNFYGQTSPSAGIFPRYLLSTMLFALLVQSAAAVWLVVRLTAPLQRMATAATRLGMNLRATPMEENGPVEVRTAARAFNLMQKRLLRLIENRTGMLAAISHDLRTPITQMRLRTELAPSSEEQDKTLAALDEMNTIIGTFLDYARISGDTEETALLDLGTLVESICDDFGDMGAQVTCTVAGPVRHFGKRVALKRAFTNVIENAIKYGGSASVSVAMENGAVVVLVDDMGPGIVPESLDAVFQPFRRLSDAEARQTEGFGLGLSIAQMIFEDHGGSITLLNRDGRGLRATIRLPVQAAGSVTQRAL